jgi:hypothetical protein
LKVAATLGIALLLSFIGCSAQPGGANSSPASIKAPASNDSLAQLFSRIWLVTKSQSPPPPGSIYIFLPNGTLVETSCVETYRIATWTVDQNAPRVLRVVEDGQPVLTATITELSDTTLRLQQELIRSHEKKDLTLIAIEKESVCPDLPK